MMMQELERGAAAGVAPLFAELGHHLAVRAVLAGTADGRVFADVAAGQAVVWVQHRVFLGGRTAPGEALVAVLRAIARAAAARGDYGFGLYYSPAWENVIPALLAGMQSFDLPRQYWERSLAGSAQVAGATPLPAGLCLEPVEAALVAAETLGRIEQLRDELCSERPSVEDFLARSFGVCLVAETPTGRELAGWCLSEYNCDGRCEVGIETAEPYRRQGLATALTLALCSAAQARGLHTVGWHCLAANQPSAATARRAGFTHKLTYPSHVVQLR